MASKEILQGCGGERLVSMAGKGGYCKDAEAVVYVSMAGESRCGSAEAGLYVSMACIYCT
jgi:hypothetical protein